MNEDRFKFRVWDIKNRRYDLSFSIDTDGWLWGGHCPRESAIIEQCTGLRDKNGKLIYEGDIIEYCYGEGNVDESRQKYFVMWHKEERRMVKVSISDFEWLKNEYPGVSCEKLLYEVTHSGIKEEFANIREIIGNIHEEGK